jgi:hypothetical protein
VTAARTGQLPAVALERANDLSNLHMHPYIAQMGRRARSTAAKPARMAHQSRTSRSSVERSYARLGSASVLPSQIDSDRAGQALVVWSGSGGSEPGAREIVAAVHRAIAGAGYAACTRPPAG